MASRPRLFDIDFKSLDDQAFTDLFGPPVNNPSFFRHINGCHLLHYYQDNFKNESVKYVCNNYSCLRLGFNHEYPCSECKEFTRHAKDVVKFNCALDCEEDCLKEMYRRVAEAAVAAKKLNKCSECDRIISASLPIIYYGDFKCAFSVDYYQKHIDEYPNLKLTNLYCYSFCRHDLECQKCLKKRKSKQAGPVSYHPIYVNKPYDGQVVGVSDDSDSDVELCSIDCNGKCLVLRMEEWMQYEQTPIKSSRKT